MKRTAIRPFVTAFSGLVLLTFAGLPGCGGHEPEAPPTTGTGGHGESTASAGGSGGSPAAGGGGAASSVTSSGSGGGTGGGTGGTGGAVAPPADVYADPSAGSDANPGTEAAPFKTLKKALSAVVPGHTVYLQAGTYDAQNGEDFADPVPAGVIVKSVVGETAILAGLPAQTALRFSGDGVASGLQIHGFGTAIAADSGTIGIDSLLLSKDDIGVELAGSAKATVTGALITSCTTAIRLRAASTLVMNGGSLSNNGADCGVVGHIAYLDEASELSLIGVDVHDNLGSVALVESSHVLVEGSTFTDNGSDPCPNLAYETFRLGGLPTLHLVDTVVTNDRGTAIHAWEGGNIIVTGGSFSGVETAVIQTGAAWVTIDGTTMAAGPGGYEGIIAEPGAHVTIANANISGFSAGVEVKGGFVEMRGTSIAQCGNGVYFASGTLDMGTVADPGGNTLSSSTDTALRANVASFSVIDAAGNWWIKSSQGAGPLGFYASHATIAGPYGGNAPAPRNFWLSSGVSVSY